MSILTRRDGVLTRIDRRVRLDAEATRVSEAGGAPISSRSGDDRCDCRAMRTSRQAALRAALDAGIPWSDFDRRVVIVWDGAPHAVLG